MPKKTLHVKVVIRVKPEFRADFERELMAVREKCIAENECVVFDIEQRMDDPSVYLLIETWSDSEFFEKVHLNRDYFPPYLARTAHMMAGPRERHYWTRLATYPKRPL